ncbi:MAG: flagellar basal body-associated FliL family protein [bacterium]|nr:flagellar basal body-associated FliL family protein [bacterium]
MAEEKDEKVEVEEEPAEEQGAKEEKETFFTKIKAKLSKVLGLLIGAILIVLISVGISYMISSYVNKKDIREIEGKIVIPPPPPYETVDFGEYTMNIQGDDEEPHFIRARIVLAYGTERDFTLAAEVGKRRPQISNIINMILSGKRKAELDTPEQKRNLAIEIREQINQILQSGKVKDVYFTSITVM